MAEKEKDVVVESGKEGSEAGKVIEPEKNAGEMSEAEKAEAADVKAAGSKTDAGAGDKLDADGKPIVEKDRETLKVEVDTLTKRLRDHDSHIQTLEGENAEFRKTKKDAVAGSSEKLSAELSARFPKEAEEIARLRLEGNDLEADDLSARVRMGVYEERVSKETEARDTLISDSQKKNKFGDFSKYEKAIKEGLATIPLHILQARPDYWVNKEYNTAVGADYLALKKEQADAAAGKTGKKVDGGAGQSQISDSPGGGEKSEAQALNDGIRSAFKREDL